MTTQLRLIPKAGTTRKSGTTRRPAPKDGTAKTAAATASTPRPLRGRRTPRTQARRSVHWHGQWSLDNQTRTIGKAGVASAREALARAHPDDEYRAAS